MDTGYVSYQRVAKIYPVLKEFFSDDIKSLCHYTSTEVLDILLKTATFRATNMFYLNDSSEYESGIELLKNKLQNYKDSLTILNAISSDKIKSQVGLYSISFSEEKDMLQQWITYAKESGVCIELDSKLLEQLAIKTIPQKNHVTNTFEDETYNIRHAASDVIYKMQYDSLPTESEYLYKLFSVLSDDSSVHEIDKNEVINHTIDYTEKCWKDNPRLAKLFLQLVASFIKNKDFKGEKEIRAIFFAEHDGEETVNRTKIEYFKTQNGVLRPYCNISFCEDTFESKNILPLKSIVIGPSGKQQVVFDSVVHRLKYGEKSIWDYYSRSPDMFVDNFNIYAYGAIKRYMTDHSFWLDKQSIIKIYDLLKNDFKDQFEEVDVSMFSVEKFESYLKTESVDSYDYQINNDELIRIHNELKINNFFSKEGVWVSKSNIPYIF